MNEQTVTAALLSNGSYSVLVTAAGGGCSALDGFAINRWQPDPLAVHDGVVLYLRDRETGEYWLLGAGSNGGVRADAQAVEQWCQADGLELRSVTTVAKNANVERRVLTITNGGPRPRQLELTSYLELALNAFAADAAHPAFSRLFVQTAWASADHALLAWRRPRSPEDRPFWVAQRLEGATEFETDRARFIGRTRAAADAYALQNNDPLSGTTGTVLDPCFAARVLLTVPAGGTVRRTLTLCAGADRAEVMALLNSDADKPAPVTQDIGALQLPASWSASIALDLAEHAWAGGAQRPRPIAQPRTRFGDFNDEGNEYVLEVGGGLAPTPQPWINVVANEDFGFLVSERGAGYTWAGNSRENRLTPWSNDALTDPPGELLYAQDRESGDAWSLLPDAAGAARFEVRHGFGYSRFRHQAHGFAHDVCVFVARGDPVKCTRVRVTNQSERVRRIAVTSAARLVLGTAPAATRAHVETRYADGLITARNPQRGEFSGRVAFAFDVATNATGRTASGSWRAASVPGAPLDGRFGSGLEPGAALQRTFELQPGETAECAFLLGEGSDEPAVHEMRGRCRSVAHVDRALVAVTAFWRELLGRVQVSSPVPALDLMGNGWLAYQNIVCRMWGRSAFYQSGGAFGFRDQLQDSSALIYLDPEITRRQILLHAAHQFVEGDVLHWWHPPTSKGIRTRFSDDLLWLPYITLFYLEKTRDHAILDEEAGWKTAPLLADGDDEVFVHPEEADGTASLYEHCCRALDRSLTRGAHGLPLIGVGDWNDGMNRVGREGRGESVWLGFFLFQILGDFIPLCRQRGDEERAQRYAAYLDELHTALNDEGWDGAWYRRAYYDNGEPLGSAGSDECRIDALAQAWAVLSGAAPAERAAQALQAMQAHLVAERDGIIRLLTPAFDRTPNDPGYIKGYVPGVRENGGQYTHAALWAVRALCEHGERERAAALLTMLSPVTRARQAMRYGGEPYVIAADVYGESPHVGRAGWTWYTGSAGWMYRVYLESVLGFDLQGDVVRLRPCVPADWPGYSIRFRRPDGTTYTLVVTLAAGASSTSHGQVTDGCIEIPLARDGGEHVVDITAGDDVVPRYEPRTAPLLRMTSE